MSEAEAICAIHRRSIVELCVADHRHDPAILEAWLASKTPDNVRRWIERADNNVLVAEEGEGLLAVGCVRDSGEILLNYVSPEARFRGVSKAMLAALEAVARARRRALLARQHRDRATPLSFRRLSRRRPAARELRIEVELSDGEALGGRGGKGIDGADA